jgi:HK97 family phage prohead protease
MSTQPTFIRAFPVAVERTGPHQLTGRLVPYGQVAYVADQLPNGEFEVYQEGFRSGAFKRQVSSPEPGVVRKIGLIHRHDGGLGFLGPFVALREAADGLYGDVRILPTKADDVEALLEEGVNELSVEFRLHKSDHTQIDESGVRWRTGVHLDQVALEPQGAYSNAQVLAYRSEIDDEQKAQAQAEAERKAAEEEAAAKAAEEQASKERAEKEAQEAVERKRRWEELAARVDDERAKQAQYLRDYGVTQLPGHPR